MEKKKLHRIVGLLILIAAVIIILPLVTSRNDVPVNKTVSVEAPPFPGSEANTDNATTDNAAPAPSPAPVEPSAAPAPADQSSPSAAPAESTAPAELPPAISPPSSAVVVPSGSAAPATVEPAPAKSDDSAAKPQASLSQPAVTKKLIAPTAWAVQMGHFHNHGNAVRLANRLRTAGFKAFTRQVVSRTGAVSTRVYVGPEVVESSARKLSGDIRAQLRLQGMVVPFEPLSL